VSSVSALARARAVVLLAVVLLAAPVAARADFQPVPAQAGGQDFNPQQVLIGGSVWAAIGSVSGTGNADDIYTSTDEGRTWTRVQDNGDPADRAHFQDLALGPDGSLWGTYRQIWPLGTPEASRLPLLGHATSASAPLNGVPVTLPSGHAPQAVSVPAWDGSGRRLIAMLDGMPTDPWSTASGTLYLATLSDSGATTILASTQVPGTWCPYRAGSGWPLRLRSGPLDGQPYITCVGYDQYTWSPAAGQALQTVAVMPTFHFGPLTFGNSRADTSISYDGGAHWGDPGSRTFEPVAGNPNLLLQGPDVMARAGKVALDTGLQVPCSDYDWLGSRMPAVQEPDGLYVFCGGAVYVSASIPSPPAHTGPYSVTSETMLARLNAYRAQAGLPPVISDGLIAQAAANHSRYEELNGGDPGHLEMAGDPGFTGLTMADRCTAVGTSCNVEVLFPAPVTATGTVDDLMTTVYHRDAMLDPSAEWAGGGLVPGGPGVIDLAQGTQFNIGGIAYPVGNYDGPLSWDCSREIPPPCQASRTVGTPILYTPPWGTMLQSLTMTAGGKPVPLWNGFPADPLDPGTTYTVNVTYQQTAPFPDPAGSPVGPTFTDSFSFHTAGTAPNPLKKRPTWNVRALRVRNRQLTVLVTVRSGKGQVGAVATCGQRRITLHRRVHGSQVRLTARLSVRGRWIVTVRFAGMRGWRSAQRTLHVSG